jgi:hypothetical protein
VVLFVFSRFDEQHEGVVNVRSYLGTLCVYNRVGDSTGNVDEEFFIAAGVARIN